MIKKVPVPLYVVTLREKNNPNCERDVYVNAASIRKAEEIALRVNPVPLWRPKAVAVRLLGNVY